MVVNQISIEVKLALSDPLGEPEQLCWEALCLSFERGDRALSVGKA
jgi:hypothetical protein